MSLITIAVRVLNRANGLTMSSLLFADLKKPGATLSIETLFLTAQFYSATHKSYWFVIRRTGRAGYNRAFSPSVIIGYDFQTRIPNLGAPRLLGNPVMSPTRT